MNKEAQRIAIAEACGWKPHADGFWYKTKKHPLIRGGKELPDFPNDLNSMHEAEKVLTDDQLFSMDNRLYEVCNGSSELMVETFTWRATASQRSEAFLRTLNLWKESKKEGGLNV